jgi:DNA-binding FadR family transcriptional regulator
VSGGFRTIIVAMSSAPLLTLRVSRAEAVAREIEGQILAGLEPGHRIGTKADVRERYGVAVATVNEAVRLLEIRGLIEARPGPGGGIFVAQPATRVSLAHLVLGFKTGSASYTECLEVRDALEPLLCRDAALHHRAEDVRALRSIVEKMGEHADDPAGYFKLNFTLHRRIAKLTPNAALRAIYLTLIDYLEASLNRAEYAAFDGVASTAVHRELVDAIAAGPGKRLDAAIAAHAPLRQPLVG